jgi:hypothetical protein
MKKIIIACMLLVLLSSTALAAIIDGPANVRDKRKGKVIISLNDGVEVYILRKRKDDKWHLIFVQAVLSEGDINKEGRIRKGAVLLDKEGKEIGKTLEEVSTFARTDIGENKPKVDIWSYTYEGNIVKRKLDITDKEHSYRQVIRDFGWGVVKIPGADLTGEYTNDVCLGMKGLWELGKEAKYARLIIKVMKEDEISYVRACAAEALRNCLPPICTNPILEGPMRGEVVPALKEALKDGSDNVRLEAAGALLTHGEGDEALPVLDEIASKDFSGVSMAIYYLFGFERKVYENGEKAIVNSYTYLLDERGMEILKKARNYKNIKVSQMATSYLEEIEKKEQKKGTVKDDAGK